MNANRNKLAGLALFGTALVAGSIQPAAAALTLDPSTIIADIATVVTFISTVGLAVLGMVFVAKGIKWARRAG